MLRLGLDTLRHQLQAEGAGQHHRGRRRADVSDGHADARRHPHPLVVEDERDGGRGHEPLRYRVGLSGRPPLPEQDRELVPAEPGDRVPRPDCGEEARRGLLEQLVAGGVTVAVVDVLEPVQVDVEDDGPVAGTIGSARRRAWSSRSSNNAVGQAGRAVVEGVVGDLPLGQDPVGHLVHRDDDARDVRVLGQADHANAEPAWPVRVHPAAQLGSHDRALGAESPTEERLDLVPVDEDGDVDQLRAGRNGSVLAEDPGQLGRVMGEAALPVQHHHVWECRLARSATWSCRSRAARANARASRTAVARSPGIESPWTPAPCAITSPAAGTRTGARASPMRATVSGRPPAPAGRSGCLGRSHIPAANRRWPAATRRRPRRRRGRVTPP